MGIKKVKNFQCFGFRCHMVLVFGVRSKVLLRIRLILYKQEEA